MGKKAVGVDGSCPPLLVALATLVIGRVTLVVAFVNNQFPFTFFILHLT